MTTWDLIFLGGLVVGTSAVTLLLTIALCVAAKRGDKQVIDSSEVFTEETRLRATERLRGSCQ